MCLGGVVGEAILISSFGHFAKLARLARGSDTRPLLSSAEVDQWWC